PSFSGRTVLLFDTILVHQGEGSGTPTEPHHTPSPEAHQSPQHDLSSSIHPHVTTATIPTVIPTDNSPLRQYSRRARIAQSSALSTAADELASPFGDDSQEMASKIAAQDLEIASLKARIKLLEDKDGGVAEPSGEDATIKGRSLETREEAAVEKSTERGSNDTEELVNVITSLDAANILTSGGVQVEYEQFAGDLSIEERIELINDLKQQREFYMSVLKSHSRWKAKHFKGISLEEIREKFIPVWKQIEDFVLMGSKEERER
nr:hypothetical protein [Tanacetum cinerariifolium]